MGLLSNPKALDVETACEPGFATAAGPKKRPVWRVLGKSWDAPSATSITSRIGTRTRSKPGYSKVQSLSDPKVGDLIDGRYSLTREIARGGGGAVFQAIHQFTKRPVAVKLLTSQYLVSSEHRERLLREAQALTVARHRNVVEVLDAGVSEGGGPYLVMELLDGRSLDGLLASRRRLKTEEAIWVVQQMASAVARMHRLGLVHRDVKPGNAFVAHTEAGEEILKLLDYGTISLTDVEQGQRITHQSALIGTPEYMAPEQLLGSTEPDPRIDVYALGISLYECLSGAVPFEGTFGQVLLKVHQTTAPPLSEKGVEVPKELEQLIECCIAKEATARYANAGKVWDALAAIARTLPSPEESLLGIKPSEETQSAAGPVRRFARAPYVTPVTTIQSDGVQFQGRNQDLSEGGLLVLLPLSCKPEHLSFAEFALPISGQVVRVPIKGRWVRSARMASAVGLEFTMLSDAHREEIHQYVTSLVNK